MKEKLKNKILLIATIICVVGLIGTGILVANLFQKRKEPKVSTQVITERMTELSELATSQLQYRGIIRYEEGDIPLLTKKGYTMLYDATVKAGVDLKQASVKISGKKIHVILPSAEILDISINPDTLEFYDEKNAIFNWENKKDTVTALKLAKEDADKRIDETELLTNANTQAQQLIKSLLLPLQGANEYEIIFDS